MNKVKDDNQNIANAILRVRQENKLSQEEFAEKVGVTRQAVSRWEMGVSVPSINTFILISDIFNVSIDSMVKNKENVDEKIILNYKRENSKLKYNKEIAFIVIGFLGVICLPFLAEWEQAKNMERFKTAYTHSYDYIIEYPLSILLALALVFIGYGTYSIIKRKDEMTYDKKD